MGILQKTLSLFTRSKPEETSKNLPPVEPINEPASMATLASDNVIPIYGHGFTNGIYRISKDGDSFERFLEYCNHLDRVKDQRELNQKTLVEVEVKLNAAMSAYSADINTFIEKSKFADNISLSLSELEQRRLENGQKEKVLVAQAKETISEYSWMPAFLYFAAGITFIIADISITKQITSWGFNMTGWQSWIFAIGLASIAFLIKPMIDRLLEKPFQASGFKLKNAYKFTLLGITVIGLGMLFCLGEFRSDSEIAQNDIRILQGQMDGLDPHTPAYIELQKRCDTINKSLDQNAMGQTGLILSGMLFAIGGAICLSIAFGSLKQLINRYWILPFRIRQLKKEIDVIGQQVATARSEHTAIKTTCEQAEKSIAASEAPLLKEELKKLQEERLALVSEFYTIQYEKERALYLDGKNKGGKYSIEGDLLYKVSDNDHSAQYLGKPDTKEDALPSTRPYTRRPFVKMRKMIADNFNKNQNSQTYDGSEFEILS
jgi:hypothetical protein